MKGIKIKDKWKPYLVFAIFAFILYSNTLNHSFVLDDVVVIQANKFTQQGIKGIPSIIKYDTFEGYWQVLFESSIVIDERAKNILTGGRYRPLSLVTFALEVEFFGKQGFSIESGRRFSGNAFISHLDNILLYLITSCLLFLILRKLIPPTHNKKWYLTFPFLATLLFLAHPIHTEVVANIKGRDEIMALLGSLSALWFTIKYIDDNKLYNLLLSGISLFLGLLSKENSITFLAIIPLSIYYFKYKNVKQVGISLVPLVVVSVVFLIIRANIIGFVDKSEIVPELMNNPFINATRGETIATCFFTLLLYLKLLLFPHPLTYDYYPFHIEIVKLMNPLVIISLLLYWGMGIYAVYGMAKKRDLFSWSIWLYLLPLSVVSNLFFPIGVFMGERFVFFSSIGFVVFIGWMIYRYVPILVEKFISNRRTNTVRILVTVVGLILCLYSFKTLSRNRAWKDNFTLLTTDVKISKNSVKGNFLAGSQFLLKAINLENENKDLHKSEYSNEALKLLLRSLQLYPQNMDAIEQLGILYFFCDTDVAQALHCYALLLQHKRSINKEKMMKSIIHILTSTDTLLDEKTTLSTPEEILISCDELLKAQDDIGEAFYLKGILFGKYLNNNELALENYKKALSIDFLKTAKFYEYTGVAFAISGDYSNALQYLLRAIELGTDDYTTYINLGTIYKELGNYNTANFYTNLGEKMKESQNSK